MLTPMDDNKLSIGTFKVHTPTRPVQGTSSLVVLFNIIKIVLILCLMHQSRIMVGPWTRVMDGGRVAYPLQRWWVWSI